METSLGKTALCVLEFHTSAKSVGKRERCGPTSSSAEPVQLRGGPARRFITGSNKAPVGGLGELPLYISRHGPDSDRLPQAHTSAARGQTNRWYWADFAALSSVRSFPGNPGEGSLLHRVRTGTQC